MLKRGSLTYSRRQPRGLYPWRVINLPWGRYERGAHLFWRIRIPLWLALGAAGWALLGPAGLAGGLVAAYVGEAMISYRKPPGTHQRPVPVNAERAAALRAEARRMQWRWENEAVPSPGGWRPPPGTLPAWSWTPPDGLRPRLDRVPAWVHLWYKTPFLDRYAHKWMWEHAGWDVLPPTTHGQP